MSAIDSPSTLPITARVRSSLLEERASIERKLMALLTGPDGTAGSA